MKLKTKLRTPLGSVLIEGDHQGISRIQITDEVVLNPPEVPDVLKESVNQLSKYFSGNLKEFDLKLNPEGTDFQKKVWHHLLQIPFGKRISYLELAKEFGDVKAIRAIASANGRNPLWIVIPCHRVVGSDGSLTGYAGGLWRKEWLLNHEAPVKQEVLF